MLLVSWPGPSEILIIILFIAYIWYYSKVKTSFTTGFLSQFLYYSAWAISYVTARHISNIDVKKFLVFMVFAICINLAGIGVSKIQKRRAQTKRDKRAVQIRKKLDAGEQPAYSLFLRPFISAGKMKIQYTDIGDAPWLYTNPEKSKDLETIFADALESTVPLIGLGKKSDYEGTGKTESSDKEWQNELKFLAKNANILIVVPSSNDGIKWEIKWILKNKYLKKCIFIMPPAVFVKSFNWEINWNITKNELKNFGIDLPQYNKRGLIFTYGNDKKINFRLTIDKSNLFLYSRRKIRQIARAIISTSE